MNRVTIGVDPGLGGGITYHRLGGVCRSKVYPMPVSGKEIDLGRIKDWTEDLLAAWGGEWHAWIEEAQAFPGAFKIELCAKCGFATCRRQPQGVVSTATFVGGARLIEGCLRGMGIECTRIKAQEWQKIMLGPNRPRGRVALKAASIAKAQELFPGAIFKRTPRCTTFSDGMADSALIAACGSRMNVV